MPRKKWSEIRAKASPEVLSEAEEVLTSLRLGELRRARNLTQEAVADRLDVRQVSVSRMESRGDVRVSTLRSVVAAMGGALDVLARFPDAVYRIAFTDSDGDARIERVESQTTNIGTATFVVLPNQPARATLGSVRQRAGSKKRKGRSGGLADFTPTDRGYGRQHGSLRTSARSTNPQPVYQVIVNSFTAEGV